MAVSKCIKCDSNSFEISEIKARGSNFKLMAVQCSSCGGVVGIQEFMNIGAMLFRQNGVLNKIAAKLGFSGGLET